MFAHRKLKATGEDKRETIKRLELQLAAKYNRVKGKDAASIDVTKGLTAAEKKKLGLKKGGMAMKKKGYAKGGMKKKGMAMGGMKKKGYAMGGMRVKYKVGGMVKGKSYGMGDNRKKK